MVRPRPARPCGLRALRAALALGLVSAVAVAGEVRVTVERGRALFVSDHGVVPVSRGRGCLVHEGGGQL